MVIAHDLPSGLRLGPAPEPALTAAEVDRLGICADCGRAQLLPVQPYARCLSADGPFAGRTVFAGQRVCSATTPCGDDLRLARRGIVHALKRPRPLTACTTPHATATTMTPEYAAPITAPAMG